jgi:hypothetical protein
MAILLMNLRNVPDDEADEIRALLEQHRIDFYETQPNRWGISAGGIWLRDEAQLEEAKRLLAQYQEQRVIRARQEPLPRKHPLQVVIYLAVVALILYLSIKPFLDLGG